MRDARIAEPLKSTPKIVLPLWHIQLLNNFDMKTVGSVSLSWNSLLTHTVLLAPFVELICFKLHSCWRILDYAHYLDPHHLKSHDFLSPLAESRQQMAADLEEALPSHFQHPAQFPVF